MAGLAAETKYTGLLLPAIFFAHFIPWAANPLIPAAGPLVMRRYNVPRAIARVYRVLEDFVVPDFPPGT